MLLAHEALPLSGGFPGAARKYESVCCQRRALIRKQRLVITCRGSSNIYYWIEEYGIGACKQSGLVAECIGTYLTHRHNVRHLQVLVAHMTIRPLMSANITI